MPLAHNPAVLVARFHASQTLVVQPKIGQQTVRDHRRLLQRLDGTADLHERLLTQAGRNAGAGSCGPAHNDALRTRSGPQRPSPMEGRSRHMPGSGR